MAVSVQLNQLNRKVDDQQLLDKTETVWREEKGKTSKKNMNSIQIK